MMFNHGDLKRDPSGTFNYIAHPNGDVHAAAAEALTLHRQQGNCVMKFWHLNTYAPVNESDTAHMLIARHETWRFEFYNGSAESILRLVASHAGVGKPILARSVI